MAACHASISTASPPYSATVRRETGAVHPSIQDGNTWERQSHGCLNHPDNENWVLAKSLLQRLLALQWPNPRRAFSGLWWNLR